MSSSRSSFHSQECTDPACGRVARVRSVVYNVALEPLTWLPRSGGSLSAGATAGAAGNAKNKIKCFAQARSSSTIPAGSFFLRNLFWPPGHPAAWPGAVLVEGGQTSFQLSDWPLYNEAFAAFEVGEPWPRLPLRVFFSQRTVTEVYSASTALQFLSCIARLPACDDVQQQQQEGQGLEARV